MLDGSDGRDPALFGERQKEDGRRDFVLDALGVMNSTRSARKNLMAG